MPNRVERSCGSLFKCMRCVVNPFKRVLVATECKIHKFINVRALEILKNDSYTDAYDFFSDHIIQLNAGVVWADQDLRCMGHFYNPTIGRGLYGNRNALSLAVDYYNEAIYYWDSGDVGRSIFYLGAAVHLVQDMAVPQHANIRLLDNHKQYEKFIRRTYLNSPRFIAHRGGYYFMNNIEEAVTCSARNSIKIYSRLKKIQNEFKRFYTMTKFVLPLAQRTTAGCLAMFYRDMAGE